MCWAGSRYRGGRYGWDGVSERQMETKEGREVTRGLGWGHGRRVDCRAVGSHGGGELWSDSGFSVDPVATVGRCPVRAGGQDRNP